MSEGGLAVWEFDTALSHVKIDPPLRHASHDTFPRKEGGEDAPASEAARLSATHEVGGGGSPKTRRRGAASHAIDLDLDATHLPRPAREATR
jgi:hypothetical protein